MQRVRLHQQSLELDAIEELTQGLDLTAPGIGGIGALGDRHPQGLAITDQGVDRLGDARLSCHPLLQQGLEGPHIQLSEQQAEGGVRRRLGDMGAEQLVEGLAVPFGKTLHAHQ